MAEVFDLGELVQHSNAKGEGLELLVEQLAAPENLSPQLSGRGPDQGRDLILMEQYVGVISRPRIRYLTSCKDYSTSGKSVPEEDVHGIKDLCNLHKVQGYLLVTTTIPSANARSLIDALDVQNGGTLWTSVWNRSHLIDLLTKRINIDIFRQFMPESYKRYIATAPLPVLLKAASAYMPSTEVEELERLIAPYERARLLVDELQFPTADSKARFESALAAFTTSGDIDALSRESVQFDENGLEVVLGFLFSTYEDFQVLVYGFMEAFAPEGRLFIFNLARSKADQTFGEWADVTTLLELDEVADRFKEQIEGDIEELFRGGVKILRPRSTS